MQNLKPTPQQVLLNELVDDLRQDRAAEFWKRYGDWIIGASVAVVLATALGVGWSKYQDSRNATVTDALVKALDVPATDRDKRAKALESVVESAGSRGAGVLASMKLAALQRERGEPEKALQTYLAVAGDASADPAMRSVAQIQALHVAADAGLENAELMRVPEKDAPLAALWNEARGWYLMSHGKKEEALKIFAALKDDAALSASLRQRMQMVVTSAASDKSAAPKAE